MFAWLDSLMTRLTDWHPMRRLLESCLRLRSRRQIAPLQAEDIGKLQTRLLRGLVHRARSTRFGKDHDFGRIRTPDDFRRLVPLTTPAELASRYWDPVFPWLSRATWPGEVVRVLERPQPDCPYLPLTRPFLQNAAGVWLTGLSQVLTLFPRRRLLAGRLLGLVDPVREPLVAATWNHFPWPLRPYLDLRNAAQFDDREFHRPTTCLLGTTEQLSLLVRRLRVLSSSALLPDVWPDLLGVLVRRVPGDATDHELLLRALDRRVVVIETVVSPQGIFAAEDARRGGLRLLADSGTYYELIQQDRRLGLEAAEPETLYELATTTASGLWATRTGVGVVFDGLQPRRVRFVALPEPVVPVSSAVPEPMSEVTTHLVRPRSHPVVPLPAPLRMPWSNPVPRG